MNTTYSITITDTIYQGESYMFNGTEYSEQGTYNANLVSKLGCDSIITLNLIVVINEHPQLLTQVNDFEIKVGDTLDISIDLESDIFYDPDDTLLDYGYESNNETPITWANLVINNGLLEINATPSLADTGCYKITIMATDPIGQVATDTFNLCVVKNYTGINTFQLIS